MLNNIQIFADLGQEVLVVANQENTSVELLQRFDERFGRLEIKMVGGLCLSCKKYEGREVWELV